MSKRGTIAISQILILILGIFAFTFMMQNVHAVIDVAAPAEDSKNYQNALTDYFKKNPSPSTTNVPSSAHGYAGKAYEWIAGPGTTAPGTAGFSVSGILQGAGWAIALYGAIKFIGPMLGLDKATTDAAATA